MVPRAALGGIGVHVVLLAAAVGMASAVLLAVVRVEGGVQHQVLLGHVGAAQHVDGGLGSFLHVGVEVVHVHAQHREVAFVPGLGRDDQVAVLILNARHLQNLLHGEGVGAHEGAIGTLHGVDGGASGRVDLSPFGEQGLVGLPVTVGVAGIGPAFPSVARRLLRGREHRQLDGLDRVAAAVGKAVARHGLLMPGGVVPRCGIPGHGIDEATREAHVLRVEAAPVVVVVAALVDGVRRGAVGHLLLGHGTHLDVAVEHLVGALGGRVRLIVDVGIGIPGGLAAGQAGIGVV